MRLNAAIAPGKMSDRSPAIVDALENRALHEPHPDVRRAAVRSYLLLTGRRLARRGAGPGVVCSDAPRR